MINQISSKLDKTLIILFSIYPLFILAGNFLINTSIITIGSVFIFKLFKKEVNLLQYKNTLFILTFFFLSLIINLFFTNNIFLSYQRVVKFFFVIFFIISFKFLIISHYQHVKIIYRSWCIIILIVIFDLIVEFLTGKNTFGQSAIFLGRLASFTGEESTIGSIFLGFCLIFLSYVYSHSKKMSLNILLAVIFIIISFLIGERANFFKTFVAISLFIFFVNKISYKHKILSIILLLLASYVIFLNADRHYKWRYFYQIDFIYTQGLTKYLDDSKYGAHRNVAKEIFLDNPIFGVGIKNFRVESGNKKYDELDHTRNYVRVSNHPHELYYEFLSETGIFGLFCFLIFILSSIIISLKNYLRSKNIYQLSGIIFIIVSILPVIPAGAFLATFTSSIFWINYGIMIGYNNLKKTKY
jgi:O-antigen ligase